LIPGTTNEIELAFKYTLAHAVVRRPSPTLTPTDPVPRGLLTLCPHI